MLKKCSNCNEFLLLDNFSKAKKGTFGRQGYCKICARLKQKKYFSDNKEVLIQKRIAWRKANDINAQKDREAYQRWRENNKETYENGWRRYNSERRLRVLFLVGRGEIRCVRCGCDRTELLEINHKDGNGHQETRKHERFIGSILSGKRIIDDLELLCKPCNNIHYLEYKFGPLPYKIIWGTNE